MKYQHAGINEHPIDQAIKLFLRNAEVVKG